LGLTEVFFLVPKRFKSAQESINESGIPFGPKNFTTVIMRKKISSNHH
jgi:hypothetical protein